MRRLLILTYLVSCALLTFAQSSIEAKVDPIEMMIGEQAKVTLTIQSNEDAKIDWPKLQPRQMLVPGVEVISTQQPTSNTMLITLTSFDGSLYHLPPFK